MGLIRYLLAFLLLAVAASADLLVSKKSGEALSLKVTANGSQPFAYQWKKNGADIVGATSEVYTIRDLKTTDSAAYSCQVKNSLGSVRSDTCLLTVEAPPTPPSGAKLEEIPTT